MLDVDGFLGDRSHFSSTNHKKVYIIFVRPPARAQTRGNKTYAATDRKLVLHFLPSAQLDFLCGAKRIRELLCVSEPTT